MNKKSTTGPSISFSYYDGSNNDFTVTNKILVYSPIKRAQSSSGTYNGGEPKEVSLSADELSKLDELINKAINCENCHQDRREMMTGMLKTGGKSYILKSRSEEKDGLEKKLKNLIK